MKFNKSSAYTLIEVLVSLMIISLLVAVGYANYRDFGRRQALTGAVKQLEGDLRRAQQSALSGIKPNDTECDNGTLTSYQVWINTSNLYNYRIRAICGGNTVLVESITLDGVQVTERTKNPINFRVLGTGADESTLTLTQDSTGKTATITIGSAGDITVN